MANPLEKQFLIIHNNPIADVSKKFNHFIEEELVPKDNKDRSKFMYWMRLWGGELYLIGTFENTSWTPDKIVSKIKKGVPEIHSVFVVEIQGMSCQGMMHSDFWEHYRNIQDLTKHMSGKRRFAKLTHIKKLIEKKEELRLKDIELKNREAELLRKQEIINEEEELLKKEEEIRKAEAELNKKEEEIKKRKKFLGIF